MRLRAGTAERVIVWNCYLQDVQMALIVAARNDHGDAVAWLLQQKLLPSVDYLREEVWSRLVYCLSSGATCDARCCDDDVQLGTSPLIAAATAGSVRVVEALLQYGADPNFGVSLVRCDVQLPGSLLPPPPLSQLCW